MAVRPQRIVSLCTGYGGLELGLEIAGLALQPLVYVEREVYAAANLVARMEDKTISPAPIWDCVDTFDAAPLHGIVDGIVGGYPCQPFSAAGRRRGVEDGRHLWPHFARIIQECGPRWCFLENVSNHLRLGFREVAEELRAMGYRVAAALVTAEEVGAPHKRERLFILANHDDHGLRIEREPGKVQHQDPSRNDFDRCRSPELANPNGEKWRREFKPGESAANGWPGLERVYSVFPPGQDPNGSEWENWPWPCIESEVRKRPNGHPYWVDELRLNGGGVVPLQAAYAFSLLVAEGKER